MEYRVKKGELGILIKWKRFREWSIRTKLLVLSAILLVVTISVQAYLSYTLYTSDLESKSMGKVQQIIEQIGMNIDTYLDELYRLTLFPYRNTRVMSALEEPAPPDELGQLEKRRLIENYLDEIMIYPRQDILRVSIMTEDEIYASARMPSSIIPHEQLRHLDWYQAALASNEYIFVPSADQINQEGDVSLFSIVKQLRSISNTQRIVGIIKADANYNGIVDIINKAEMGSEGAIYVIDERQHIIYSSGEQFRQAVLADNAENLLRDQGYLINSTTIPRVNWEVIAVTSISEMNIEAVRSRNIALMIALISTCAAILLLYILLHHLIKPLIQIVRLMKEVELGKLDVTFTSVRQDEIGYLGNAFNRLIRKFAEMLQQNTSLVKEVYESKLLQKEAQINSLYNQIRPHFIFNTLNLISLMMQTGRTDKAIHHINQLSSILRSMTQWDKEIRLEKEITLLHAYLDIQKSRFDGRLAVQIDIDPKLHEMLIPALLLQPIVENAVIHGCEKQRELTTITVTSLVAEDRRMFIVEDDGAGMDEETWRSVQRKVDQLAESESVDTSHNDRGDGHGDGLASAEDTLHRSPALSGNGIGLVNVNKRIKVKYGEAYGISIWSQLGIGTKVTVTLPNQRGGSGGEWDINY